LFKGTAPRVGQQIEWRERRKGRIVAVDHRRGLMTIETDKGRVDYPVAALDEDG
jgi:hypothetical protein